MTAALSPQFGKMSSATPPKLPTPISAPASQPVQTPLSLGANTASSFQRQTAWRTPEGMSLSAHALGSTLNFAAGQEPPAAPISLS
jgi:hypothetical protein